MVLTVTLNPLLERRWTFKGIKLNDNNRSINESLTVGGKGLNVSRQLNRLGVNNLAFTFLGGAEGKIMRSLLTNENINYSFVPTKDNTRSALLAIEAETNRLTTLFGPNSTILENEAEEFKNKLDKMIHNCSVVVFSGSSPSEFTDEIFSYGIELAHNYDKISVLDTYGKHLPDCIKKGPTVIHNNIQEIRNSLDFKLPDEKSIIDYLNYLYTNNIKLSLLTDGAGPAYISKFDFIHKFTPPEISPVDTAGSGDALVAGIVYGLENNLPFEEFVITSFKLAVLNAASSETCNTELEKLDNFSPPIEIIPVGKKMKIIDDSPNYQ